MLKGRSPEGVLAADPSGALIWPQTFGLTAYGFPDATYAKAVVFYNDAPYFDVLPA